jgi:hypothetical protein
LSLETANRKLEEKITKAVNDVETIVVKKESDMRTGT